jgi:hypothetical protein
LLVSPRSRHHFVERGGNAGRQGIDAIRFRLFDRIVHVSGRELIVSRSGLVLVVIRREIGHAVSKGRGPAQTIADAADSRGG